MIRLAARGSALSLAQTGIVADALRALGHEVEVRPFQTTGDRLSRAGAPIEGKGIFTKEIDEAVLAGEADLGVHSLKDLPFRIPPGLTLAAVPSREDPRDALISASGRGLADLPSGARVGTGSPRRRAQLCAARPDLRVVDARGNVDTRIRRLSEAGSPYEAIVLACAGLARLGRREDAAEVLPVETMIPAIGQGALALIARQDDAASREAASALEDPAARRAVEAERVLLEELEAGCRAPIAGHARVTAGRLVLIAGVFSLDGAQRLIAESAGPPEQAEQIGRRAARELRSRGAAELVAGARP